MDNKYVQIAHQSGIVGAGGAGFPTHVKLNADVEYLIINAAECEPLISVDQVLMDQYTKELINTIDDIRKNLGAKQAIIGVKEKHRELIEKIEKTAEKFDKLSLAKLGDFYPAGDEVVLVYETTQRQIPQGGIPLDCGVVVINVETIYNLWKGAEGFPLTQKWLTIGGHVKYPGTYCVPLGVSVKEMLTLAGGPTIAKYHIINGGPMMGKLVESQAEVVTKTTKALLVLDEMNPVIINRLTPIDKMLKIATSVCCQCHICTDLCPRNLLGYDINPNKIVVSASYGFQVSLGHIQNALLCSECGACDMFACPMGLSPRRINGMLKELLLKERLQVPERGKAVTVDRLRPYRRIPTNRLLERLAIKSLKSPISWIRSNWRPDTVSLPLKQHIGASSVPCVMVGDYVKKGQLIANIGENTLGSQLFASIDGQIKDLTDETIIISKE